MSMASSTHRLPPVHLPPVIANSNQRPEHHLIIENQEDSIFSNSFCLLLTFIPFVASTGTTCIDQSSTPA